MWSVTSSPIEQGVAAAAAVGHPLLSNDFEAATDRHTLTRTREGNAVEFLPSGRESYERRWAALHEAERSIDLVALSMMRDGTTRRLCDLLRTKLARGVRVRVIVDDAVAYSTMIGPWLSDLAKAGASVLRYHPLFRDVLPDLRRGHPFQQLARTVRLKIKRRFHEKYMVIDGRAAVLGGINWGDKYAFGGLRPKAWRDTDVFLCGPIVADIQWRFVRDFFLYEAYEREYTARRQPGFDREMFLRAASDAAERFACEQAAVYFPTLPAAGPDRVRYVPHKPYDEGKLQMTEAMVLMLREAQRYIYWGCHGVRPPRLIAETLANAAARGVEVRLITNSRRSSRTLMFFGLLDWMYWESSNHFPWLLENGIRLFEWQRPGAFHSKNVVIDDLVASVGSYNIASGSAFHHTESSVIVYGGDFPELVRKQFEIDLQDCRELTLDTIRPVPPKHQPMLRLLDEQNLLVPPELRTEAINRDLDAGLYKERAGAL